MFCLIVVFFFVMQICIHSHLFIKAIVIFFSVCTDRSEKTSLMTKIKFIIKNDLFDVIVCILYKYILSWNIYWLLFSKISMRKYLKEGLPGYVFSRGSIYLLRIYWDLLAVSVFQLALTLTLNPRKINPGSCWPFLVSLSPNYGQNINTKAFNYLGVLPSWVIFSSMIVFVLI